jgi:hypothetical protein
VIGFERRGIEVRSFDSNMDSFGTSLEMARAAWVGVRLRIGK